jgi:hypothetical protein
MPACSNCGGRICKGDVKCFTCEISLVKVKSKAEANLERFKLGVTIMFFICLALTLASMFFDFGFSFGKCAAATVILHFVKMSAVQMLESRGNS